MYPSKVGTTNTFFAWNSYVNCGTGDGLYGALGHWPQCEYCSEEHKKFGKFYRGIRHKGKNIEVEYSNLWVKGGTCLEEGAEKGTPVEKKPENKSKSELTEEELEVINSWKKLGKRTARSSSKIVKRWSDFEIRDRIKEIVKDSIRPVARKIIFQLMVKLLNNIHKYRVASGILELIHEAVVANVELANPQDNSKEFESMVSTMNRNKLFFFMQSLSQKLKFKLIEACRTNKNLRRIFAKVDFLPDIVPPLVQQQIADNIDDVRSNFENIITKNFNVALSVMSKGKKLSSITAVDVETLKILTPQALEKTYKAISKENKKAAYMFKQLELKGSKCERYHKIPMCNVDSFDATRTSLLLPNSHREIQNVFAKLNKVFRAAKEFYGPRMTTKCLRLWKKSTCNAFLPRCNSRCESQSPCKSTCDELLVECKSIFTPLSLSIFENGGALSNVVSEMMGGDMKIFQRVLEISKTCNDDIFYRERNQGSCSSLLSTKKTSCVAHRVSLDVDDISETKQVAKEILMIKQRARDKEHSQGLRGK
jgi:hypothetical protein